MPCLQKVDGINCFNILACYASNTASTLRSLSYIVTIIDNYIYFLQHLFPFIVNIKRCLEFPNKHKMILRNSYLNVYKIDKLVGCVSPSDKFMYVCTEKCRYISSRLLATTGTLGPSLESEQGIQVQLNARKLIRWPHWRLIPVPISTLGGWHLAAISMMRYCPKIWSSS